MNRESNERNDTTKTTSPVVKEAEEKERLKKTLDAEKFTRHQNNADENDQESDKRDADAWRNEG